MTDDDLAAMEHRGHGREADPTAVAILRGDVRTSDTRARRLRLKRAVAQALPPAAPHAHITEIDSCPHGG